MSTTEQSIRIHTREARGMRIAQALWILAAAASLGIVIAAIPGYLFTPILGVFEGHLILEDGTAAYALTRATHVASFLSASGSIALAIFLFVKKRSEPMGLFLSYYLLGQGIFFAGPIEMLYPYWEAAPWINSFILLPLFFGPATLALVALFPDGHFVPSWSRWLIVASLLSVPAAIWSGGAVLPLSLKTPPIVSTVLIVTLALLSLLLVIAAIYAQVYRYRHVSTLEQRLQTKWVLFGISLWFVVSMAASIGWNAALQFPVGTPVPLWLPLGSLLWVSSALLLPVTLTISINRYRLFEIDLIINRTLLYGFLTVGLVAIYIAIVGALGMLFQTQFNVVFALLATAVVAVVFQPLRQWLQKGLNRLIFGERDDPIEALSRLGSQLESALAPDNVLPTLVETIAKTLKLPYVAIILNPKQRDSVGGKPAGREAAAYGKPAPNTIDFLLTYQGSNIGRLVVASRSPDLRFSRSETRLLRNIARQAGAAVHAVQLTKELQISRQQIVTAREEERRRLRRDLHDGIGSALAGQTLKLDAVLDLMARNSNSDVEQNLEEATRLLSTLKEQTQDSIRGIRRIVYGLRPPVLDDLGLAQAIQAHVDQNSGQVQAIDFRMDIPSGGLPELSAAVEVAAYHIAIEATTNVIHHSQAKSCRISLTVTNGTNDQFRLSVEDDGVGLPKSIQKGVGMASMRERATELGGELTLERREPSGTRVLANIPLISEEL